MRGVSGSEDGAVEAIRAQALVEVGGLHGLLDIRCSQHALGHLLGGIQPRPHGYVCVRVSLLAIASIDLLKVVRYCLVHLVLLADELVSHDDGLHHRVA